MTSTEEDLLSLDHYVRKTFHKTASLMANSCKAIAILGGQNREVAQIAWEYGRHVGLAFQVSPSPALNSRIDLCLRSSMQYRICFRACWCIRSRVPVLNATRLQRAPGNVRDTTVVRGSMPGVPEC